VIKVEIGKFLAISPMVRFTAYQRAGTLITDGPPIIGATARRVSGIRPDPGSAWTVERREGDCTANRTLGLFVGGGGAAAVNGETAGADSPSCNVGTVLRWR
jgi:hypothetical protein